MDSGPASYHPENKVRKECTVPIIFIAISTRRHLDVGHPNLYFIQLVQNVSLSETQGCVSIQLTRKPFQTSKTFPIIHGDRKGIDFTRMLKKSAPKTISAYLSRGISSQPHRLGLPVVTPNSLPS